MKPYIKPIVILLNIAFLFGLIFSAMSSQPEQAVPLVSEPTLFMVDFLLVEKAVENHDLELAQDILVNALKIVPENAKVHYYLGLIYLFDNVAVAEGYFETAQNLFETAQDLDEGFVDLSDLLRKMERLALYEDPAHRNILVGQMLGAENEWGFAEIAFERATIANLGYAEAWAYLGKAQEINGKDGEFALKKAYQLNGNSLSASIFLGDYYATHGEVEKAIPLYLLAIKIAPDKAEPYASLANAYLIMGDLNEALLRMEEGMAIASHSVTLRHAYLKILLHYEVYLEERALPIINELVNLGEDKVVTDLLKGKTYLAMENAQAAKPFLESVLSIQNNHVEAYFILGLCLLQLNDVEGAISSFENALELDKEQRFTTQIEKLLEDLL